ncbi:uncharacterized protein [Cherax quadricarinatus]|uniref:uncharacterized protein n=1 Tax=Cherax quadricarinatus TaxID=27406 RepID=UPI00387EB445
MGNSKMFLPGIVFTLGWWCLGQVMCHPGGQEATQHVSQMQVPTAHWQPVERTVPILQTGVSTPAVEERRRHKRSSDLSPTQAVAKDDKATQARQESLDTATQERLDKETRKGTDDDATDERRINHDMDEHERKKHKDKKSDDSVVEVNRKLLAALVGLVVAISVIIIIVVCLLFRLWMAAEKMADKCEMIPASKSTSNTVRPLTATNSFILS